MFAEQSHEEFNQKNPIYRSIFGNDDFVVQDRPLSVASIFLRHYYVYVEHIKIFHTTVKNYFSAIAKTIHLKHIRTSFCGPQGEWRMRHYCQSCASLKMRHRPASVKNSPVSSAVSRYGIEGAFVWSIVDQKSFDAKFNLHAVKKGPLGFASTRKNF